jgi:micrococcal nuclease
MPLCSGPLRTTCVVDGDTFWHRGEKIRLAEIDAPEVEAPCVQARVLAARAAGRLAELLGRGGYAIHRTGQDRYGRTLAVVTLAGDSVGATLVAEGLARTWSGRRENWC